jgi:methionine-rich copper-binding protein CopC
MPSPVPRGRRRALAALRLLPAPLLLAPLLLASPALAHAMLHAASPAAGSTVKTPPAEVALTFSEELEPRFSTVQVLDAAGKQVDKADLHVVGGDATHVAIGLNPIGAGTYKVIWHAVSVDTHRTQGSFTFTVAP